MTESTLDNSLAGAAQAAAPASTPEIHAQARALTKAGASLLSPSEGYRVYDVGGRKIVLSALDAAVSLGEGTDLGGDFTDLDELVVFSEAVTVSGEVDANALAIATHTIDTLPGSKPCLSTAGTPGAHQPHPAMTGDGDRGGPGGPGGDIAVYLEMLSDSALHLFYDAAGGDGGAGQDAKKGTGGPGGPGGNGGTVHVGFSHPYAKALATLRECAAAKHASQRARLAKQLLAQLDGDEQFADETAKLAKLVDDGHGRDADALRGVLQALGYGLLGALAALRSELVERMDVSGGGYGVGGSGSKSDGDNGSRGEPGKRSADALVLAEAGDRPTDFVFAHPDQCDMLLAKAEMAYFTGTDEHLQSAIIWARRVFERTSFAKDLDDDSALRALYADKQASLGIHAGIEQLAQINDRAGQMLNQMKVGKDYFDHAATWAPLTSLDFLRSILDQQLSNLETIEASYTAYFDALAEQKATFKQLRAMRAKAHHAISAARNKLEMLEGMADDTARAIELYEPQIEAKKDALEEELAKAKDDITSRFSFNFNDLVNGLTMVAFAPQKFMIALQVTDLLYKGAFTVPNDKGVDVNKSYLIKHVASCKADVDSLIEGYEQQKDGSVKIDDPGAAKLVVAKKQLDKFLGEFSERLGDQLEAVDKAFDAYINTIIARNNLVLRYNAIVNTEAKYLQRIANYEQKLDEMSDEGLDKLRPDLPAISNFITRMYYDARDEVLQTLYGCSKAYRFWALSEHDLLEESFAGYLPPQINAAILRGAQTKLLGELERAVETLRRPPQHFPPPSNPQGSVELSLSDEQVDALRQDGAVIFQLEPVYPWTPRSESPFAGWANIRLDKARVWLPGASTADGVFNIDITQMGTEELVDPNGASYEFTHDPIHISFRYRDGETPQIMEDGDIGTGSQRRFAPVGPFAWWRIEVNDTYNSELNLENLEGITLEFWGTNYTFG
ncbi:hypothetical protein FIV42_19930 [Persicimonas caeni]|uniref:Uncharacterized protein n=1 Tax=Persicimonas caeni TaxID=2292766 RepID=A0A4Y6PX68_PERCE|nr:hypothetical protein [Persicimonas caeni]QDG52928.1 hypothetical protein FIV42_19930 [Persicimonas caeni]QED34150.1 hypothetical protein FRD00_19925 [Persicimonas caeni]